MDDISMEILIEDLTEEEAKNMEASIREICKKHGVENIESLMAVRNQRICDLEEKGLENRNRVL